MRLFISLDDWAEEENILEYFMEMRNSICGRKDQEKDIRESEEISPVRIEKDR